ncbi:MAG: hypothetical protein M1821_005896 [Bathelium mastoideum]|nr:MAG: hypothetical protein M1821_005896 [Bathelium mastoideum]KAI9688568.1 MAG: hypothetical protein M1822_001517 [Bathelium mastoideum]
MEAHTLDSLLELEDEYYKEGLRLGREDGERAGRIEGRAFGLQKGFEKYAELGEFSGMAAILQARLPTEQTRNANVLKPLSSESLLPKLQSGAKLERHLKALQALVDPETLPTQNTEEAVSHLDERIKSATAKAKVIDDITGEGDAGQFHRNPALVISSSHQHHNNLSEQEQAPNRNGEYF